MTKAAKCVYCKRPCQRMPTVNSKHILQGIPSPLVIVSQQMQYIFAKVLSESALSLCLFPWSCSCARIPQCKPVLLFKAFSPPACHTKNTCHQNVPFHNIFFFCYFLLFVFMFFDYVAASASLLLELPLPFWLLLLLLLLLKFNDTRLHLHIHIHARTTRSLTRTYTLTRNGKK